MGLVNIYTRLKLCYGYPFKFEFYNLPSGGAVIIIGGPL
jgi:hypothetical protein